MTEETKKPSTEDLTRAVDLSMQYPTQTERKTDIGQITREQLEEQVTIAPEDEIFVQPIIERINRLALKKNIPATEFFGILIASARGMQQQAEKPLMPRADQI